MGKNQRLSIKYKITLMIVGMAFFISIAMMFVATKIIKDIIDNNYKDRADHVAQTIAISLDESMVRRVTESVMEVYDNTSKRVLSDERGSAAWNDYVSNYSKVEESMDYLILRDQLRKYQNINDVECVYMIVFPKDMDAAMYIVDSAIGEPSPPGSLEELHEFNIVSNEDPADRYPAYITNTEEYGWLVTAGAPVINTDGSVIAYVFDDISMHSSRSAQLTYIVLLGVIALITMIVTVIVALMYINSRIVKPIALLSDTAAKFCQIDMGIAHHRFEELVVDTNGDEIDDLTESLKQMERDINKNITELLETKLRLASSMKEAEEMKTMATRDRLTGIRNRNAYDNEVEIIESRIRQGDNVFGVAIVDMNGLEATNTTYGRENGDIALKKLCELVCKVFAHSPVFRVGGDEFAVILRNRDYRTADVLVDMFEKEIRSRSNDPGLAPWERISAAIGYALYEEGHDTGYNAVFTRADANMIARKNSMNNRTQ